MGQGAEDSARLFRKYLLMGGMPFLLNLSYQEDSSKLPKAVCIPNESIDKVLPSLLPDKGQEIFVYCQSGRRSKEAAQKLADMGYKNIVEFGGIIDWHGEVVRE